MPNRVPPVEPLAESDSPPAQPESRRERLSKLAMFGALSAAYGALGAILLRFLYPSRPRSRGWMFVARLTELPPGSSRRYVTPEGESVNITRQGTGSGASDFVALSSVCPHLGCQVHWEGQNDRFFCPCHNGVFDPSGVATSGPPADAGQSLLAFPLKVEDGLLFIEVARAESALADRGLMDSPGPPGPGHDPCLHRRPKSRTT